MGIFLQAEPIDAPGFLLQQLCRLDAMHCQLPDIGVIPQRAHQVRHTLLRDDAQWVDLVSDGLRLVTFGVHRFKPHTLCRIKPDSF